MLADKTLDKLIEKRKENRGGWRPGSGRKKKLEEEEIIQRLDPMATDVFKKLHEKIKEGDMKAIQLFCAYYIGLPTQKIESKIEGNLNNIAIEIIKPNILLQDNRTVQIEDKDNM
jgi:hypothetical protein